MSTPTGDLAASGGSLPVILHATAAPFPTNDTAVQLPAGLVDLEVEFGWSNVWTAGRSRGWYAAEGGPSSWAECSGTRWLWNQQSTAADTWTVGAVPRTGTTGWTLEYDPDTGELTLAQYGTFSSSRLAGISALLVRGR